MKADGQYAAEDGREEFKEQRGTGEVAGADLLTHRVALGKLLDLSVPPLIPCKAAKSDSVIHPALTISLIPWTSNTDMIIWLCEGCIEVKT